ncbi:hypothetical protein FGG08_006393 [Glutinoglossum americanum]|uniref:valine--tRNA ligase n=1 Tax=Glutinoglossum americanum TaxID=1670608 RepID=A0A9P8I7G0_9PEZI|nr:hypothetical protein FGG08_006393 [Glutinoglossum americanum]
MATNSTSSNPIGERAGPISGLPISKSDETKAAITDTPNADSTGQHRTIAVAPEQRNEPGASGKKAKTEKELEKERKKAEKAKKFAEKQAKSANTAAAPTISKSKEKKSKLGTKEEPLPKFVEETIKGHKKILKPFDDPLYKAYNPTIVESAWYDWWEKEGFFEPEFAGPDEKVKEEGYFVIPEPPPNVTGRLHMGHALPNALQDCLIRWNRMKGKTVLWLPGCDHAGISTQSVVENKLWKDRRETKYDLGREKFTELIWDWKNDYHAEINSVLRRMGGSFDWKREAFTMDPNLSAAVTETFVRLHEEGIIYRDNRLVNWSVKLNTAISNLEVVNVELKEPTLLAVPGYDEKVEFGIIVHFFYEIDGSDEKIEVATTRPETMLGDVAIAVNPKDPRYTHLKGKFAKHPFITDRLMPIIMDEYVNMNFGTGAVKITPAHDPNDFAIGLRYKNLKRINILNDDGTMNANAGPYNGQKRFDVRRMVIEDLKAKGLYVKTEENKMVVPLCGKSGDIIEPLMKPQWWMKMRDMADDAIKAVKDGRIKIRPESAEKNYFHWLEGINDWCLSRQLWWGHQAPAYFVQLEGEEPGNRGEDKFWVTGRTPEAAEEKAKVNFPNKKFTLHQDPDVLDTWFSSGLWPFSTLGWPKETPDMARLYPTSLLETGWDILFFWVARMVMLGIKLTGQVPFKEVYCHPLIRDSDGRKMSKSLGNVIDPMDVIQGISLEELHSKLRSGNLPKNEIAKAENFQKLAFPDGIPQCGTDALRFALVAYTTGGGGDINFDIKVLHGYRKFCNKIYQATKFVLGKLGKDFVPQASDQKTGKESLTERWILHKYTIAAKEINQALEDREFQQATLIVYQYWYNQLCDVYIVSSGIPTPGSALVYLRVQQENSKAIIQDGTEEEKRSAKDTLYTALEGALTMIHPFMPFLTEELWQRLPRRPNDSTPSIVKAAYPEYNTNMDDPASEAAYELIVGISKGVRSLMAEYSLKDEGKVYVQTYDDTSSKTVREQIKSIKSLSGKGVASIEVIAGDQEKPMGCAFFAISSSAAVFLHIKGRVDIDAEIAKAQTKLLKATDGAQRQKKILSDPAYQQKVSKELQEVERKKLADFEAEAHNYVESIKRFEKLKLE